MASVPSSLLKRKSGPPSPPPKQGASDTNYPDAAGVVEAVVNAAASVPASSSVSDAAAEQAEVQTILTGYAQALPPGSVLSGMASTLSQASQSLSARALAVLAPTIIDLTHYAENAIVNGDVSNPSPITIQNSYVSQFTRFLKSQALQDLQHLVTGLQDSFNRKALEHQTLNAHAARTGKDISAGYPHLIDQLSAISEHLATLGPVNWQQIAESAEQFGMTDVQSLLAESSARAYQRQQQLEAEAKASHATSFYELDAARKRSQQIQLTSALLAGAQFALSQGASYQDLTTDQFMAAMKSAAEKALTDQLKKESAAFLKRKKKSAKTMTAAAPSSSSILMAGDPTPQNPNAA